MDPKAIMEQMAKLAQEGATQKPAAPDYSTANAENVGDLTAEAVTQKFQAMAQAGQRPTPEDLQALAGAGWATARHVADSLHPDDFATYQSLTNPQENNVKYYGDSFANRINDKAKILK